METTVQRTLKILNQMAKQNPDLLEIRFDLMRDLSSIAEIRKTTRQPIIATNRRKGEGGFFSGTESARLQNLVQAAQAGFNYVDIELNTKSVRNVVHDLKEEGAKAIVSHHNFGATPHPRVLESVLIREKSAGADVCKIVTTARTYEDNLRSLMFLNKHAKKTKLVCFAMGKMGIPSRVLSPIYGAYFTFASSGLSRETATGQIPMRSLRLFYKGFGIS